MRAFPVFDLHCDTAEPLLRTGQGLNDNTCHVSLKRAKHLARYAQFFAFCTYGDQGSRHGFPEPEVFFAQMLANFRAQLDRNGDSLCLCAGAETLRRAEQTKKCAVFLSLEGAEAIACDPGRLDWLREQGFTMTTLTWNSANALAGSHETGEGLTPRGREFVRKAQKLDILVDVSHLSERAFWEVCELAEKPIVASHCNSRSCCDCSRNLSDEQLKAISATGGVIGLNLYAPFLNPSGQAELSDVRRHGEHILELCGAEHLVLGGDLDGCDALPAGFSGLDDYNGLGAYLVQNGWTQELTQDVFYNNMARFVQKNLGKTE